MVSKAVLLDDALLAANPGKPSPDMERKSQWAGKYLISGDCGVNAFCL